MLNRRLASSFVTAFFLAALGAQQAAPAESPQPFRVHVIGASVSGGFRDGPLTGAKVKGESVTMQHLLKAWCGEHAVATTHGPLEMMAMFTNPESIGKKQIDAAKKAKPDAIVALDFPFWFAYGRVAGEDEAKARSERFTKGLELLAQLDVPVLIGDLPDMQGAAARMLAPAQIPNPAMLKDLNAQLTAWLAEHKNVRLVAMADIVQTMKTKGVELPIASGPLQTPPGALLQGDQLHANRLGMAFLGFTLQPALQALFPEGHPLRTQTWKFEPFVDACGADQELEALQAKQEPAGAGKDG